MRVGSTNLTGHGFSRTIPPEEQTIHTDGVAILLVEQNVAMALRLATSGYLLETGRRIAEDADGQRLRTQVISGYLQQADMATKKEKT